VMTQREVDDRFKTIKKVWDTKVAESGQKEQMFIATDRSGYVAAFMLMYSDFKDTAESNGLVAPELIKGLTITTA